MRSMNQYAIIPPSRLEATINLPASKSISNRVLLISALSGSTILPENLSDCDDTNVMVKALRDMPEVIDIGAAGTAMRFLTAYLSISEGTHVITGSPRMLERPIGELVEALKKLGADIEYVGREGYPPLRITGRKLTGGMIEMPGNISSQFVSALLLVAPYFEKEFELKLTEGLTSRPYIDLTLCMMRECGADAGWTSANTLQVIPGNYRAHPIVIENDWSSAAFWYEMIALSSDPEAEIKLEGLVDGSRQGDAVVRYLFSLLGIKTKFGTLQQGVPTTVTLKRSGRSVLRLDYDFANQPDIAQPMVVSCCMTNVPFRFKGLSTLRIKETDRLSALQEEMLKLGCVLKIEDDHTLLWDGERVDAREHPVINTYKDHRMAMSFAPVSMMFPGVRIDDPMVVSKSYPGFWNDLRKAGFDILNT